MLGRNPNQATFRPLSLLKKALLRGGRRPLKIRTGIYKGLVLSLDPHQDTQIYLGLSERETSEFVRRTAATCAWMVDVGAGDGDLSIFFLRQRNCKVVHAFEPSGSRLANFRQGLKLNCLSEDGRLFIHREFVGTRRDVDCCALDDLRLDNSVRGFLKIDVDGAEVDVLDGAAGLLSNGRHDVLIEVHSLQLERDCIERMGTFGYNAEVIKNAWWRLIVPEMRPTAHNRWLWCSKAAN